MGEGRSVEGGEPAMFVGKPGAQHYVAESAKLTRGTVI